jgi:hypothetical protein
MLHLIAALDRPTSGIIRVGGVDLASQKDLPGYLPPPHRAGLPDAQPAAPAQRDPEHRGGHVRHRP